MFIVCSSLIVVEIVEVCLFVSVKIGKVVFSNRFFTTFDLFLLQVLSFKQFSWREVLQK